MKTILLTQDKVALIDDNDFEYLNRWKWYAWLCSKGPYWSAARTARENGKQSMIFMHRIIMNAPPHLQVDHINHNGLDNQRANLRLCTQTQNIRYQRPRQGTASQYKGVVWSTRSNKWRARIKFESKSCYIGTFDNEIDAAKAYDQKAKELFREFAYTNF